MRSIHLCLWGKNLPTQRASHHLWQDLTGAIFIMNKRNITITSITILRTTSIIMFWWRCAENEEDEARGSFRGRKKEEWDLCVAVPESNKEKACQQQTALWRCYEKITGVISLYQTWMHRISLQKRQWEMRKPQKREKLPTTWKKAAPTKAGNSRWRTISTTLWSILVTETDC